MTLDNRTLKDYSGPELRELMSKATKVAIAAGSEDEIITVARALLREIDREFTDNLVEGLSEIWNEDARILLEKAREYLKSDWFPHKSREGTTRTALVSELNAFLDR